MVHAARSVLDRIAAVARRGQAIAAAIALRYEVTGRHEDIVRRRAVVVDVAALVPSLGLRQDSGRDCSEVKRQVVALGAWPVVKANARIYRGMRRRP